MWNLYTSYANGYIQGWSYNGHFVVFVGSEQQTELCCVERKSGSSQLFVANNDLAYCLFLLFFCFCGYVVIAVVLLLMGGYIFIMILLVSAGDSKQ